MPAFSSQILVVCVRSHAANRGTRNKVLGPQSKPSRLSSESSLARSASSGRRSWTRRRLGGSLGCLGGCVAFFLDFPRPQHSSADTVPDKEIQKDETDDEFEPHAFDATLASWMLPSKRPSGAWMPAAGTGGWCGWTLGSPVAGICHAIHTPDGIGGGGSDPVTIVLSNGYTPQTTADMTN